MKADVGNRMRIDIGRTGSKEERMVGNGEGRARQGGNE